MSLKSIIKTINNSLLVILFITYSPLLRADAFEMGMAAMEVGDYAEAYCLWRPLAMHGHVEAAFHLGWLFANGNGLRVNVPKAVYWWGQAANQGHSDAMFALALAYTNGEGIKQDDEEAMRWYLKAAAKGHEDAREIIKAKLRLQSDDVMPHLESLLTTHWLGPVVTIKRTLVNLRTGPGIDHAIADRVEQGTQLVALQTKGDWMQVINPESRRFAWVAKWLVDGLQDAR